MIWVVGASSGRRTLDELVAGATAKIERHEPAEALEAMRAGALMVDIRSDRDRERDGVVPGSLHVPRTVLEWRLDPASPWRSPHAPSLEDEVILLCDHGFSTVLAASTLVDLGFSRAGDVVGGFVAWRDAGLPVAQVSPSTRGASDLAGMRGPD